VFDRYLGEIAGIGTAVLWAATYILFTIAVRTLGAERLNRWRLLVALGFLLATHAAMFGTPLPVGAAPAHWGWLCVSGVVGFAISDTLLFNALSHLGPHRTSLIMASIPVSSALLAWGFFGEKATAVQALAGLAVVAGIALVISARPAQMGANGPRSLSVGVAFALGAAGAQSLRYIFSRQGMQGGFPVLSANVIQILAATVATWAAATVGRRWRGDLAALRRARSGAAMTGGAFTGPFLGVTLSLVALANTSVGVASTLMALPPVLLLPMSRVVFKEQITLRAVIGTGVAVGGVTLLFLLA
jgi:drug/metabolite transporter (DMT)-like permease